MDLHEQLDRLASEAAIPGGDLEAVRRTGRRRQQRARRGVGALAAVALGAAAATVVAGGNDDDGRDVLAGEPATTQDSALAWEVVDPADHLALYGRVPSVGERAVYALSTAPGQRSTDQAQPLRMWTSDDGIEWRDNRPDDDLYLSELDASEASDGVVYAIGTGQATAARVDGRGIPEVRVGHTTDGESWTTEALDVDIAGIAEHALHVGWSQREVASNGRGDVVAVVTVRAELDVPEVVPDGDPEPERWAITATGVDVLGERTEARCPDGGTPQRSDEGTEGPHRVWPDWCATDEDKGEEMPPQETHTVERSYTWDELGLEGDLRAAVLGRPIVFVSRDGGSFERVEDLPLPEGEIGTLAIEGSEEGFDLAVSAYGTVNRDATLLHSTDGVTWTPASLPSDLQWIASIAHLGESAVLHGIDAENRPVVVLGDGHVARPADELDPALVDGREVWWAGGAAGDLGIVVVLGLAERDGPAPAEYVVLTSQDGRSWSHHRVDELAGAQVHQLGTPIVTADRIVIPFVPAGVERDEDGHLPQRALVATPTA